MDIAHLLTHIIFYCFAIVVVASAVVVIVSGNSVRSVLALIVAFVASSGLWIMLQATFLGLILVIVYVGAVMTMFLFVVMMLNLEQTSLRHAFVRYLPLGLIIIALIAAMLIAALSARHFGLQVYQMPADASLHYSNVKALGMVLYTQYLYVFELAAVLLLVAIIAAIALAHRPGMDVKRQHPGRQVQVNRADRVRLVKMSAERGEIE